MSKKIGLVMAAVVLCPSSVQAASSARGTYMLQFRVAQTCLVQHRPGLTQLGAGAYSLGGLKEYCNAPGGYRVVVNYTPGTMQGAVISLGSDSVTLDGSGTAVVSQARGPRVADRDLVAKAGAAGFDTEMLSFHAIAN